MCVEKMFLPEECNSFTSINETMIIGESDVHHGSDDHLSLSHHRSLKHSVHSQDGGLRRIDDWSPEQRSKHSSVTAILDTRINLCSRVSNFNIPDCEGSTVHVFYSKFIILCFLSKSSNSLLNVSITHVSNISEDRHHQTLVKINN